MTDIRETWYRFEDRRYSNADEYGDHAYTTYEVALLTYVVAKHTPKGVWLKQYYGPNPPTGELNNCLDIGDLFLRAQPSDLLALQLKKLWQATKPASTKKWKFTAIACRMRPIIFF